MKLSYVIFTYIYNAGVQIFDPDDWTNSGMFGTDKNDVIVYWNVPTVTQPTPAQLSAITVAQVRTMLVAMRAINVHRLNNAVLARAIKALCVATGQSFASIMTIALAPDLPNS